MVFVALRNPVYLDTCFDNKTVYYTSGIRVIYQILLLPTCRPFFFALSSPTTVMPLTLTLSPCVSDALVLPPWATFYGVRTTSTTLAMKSTPEKMSERQSRCFFNQNPPFFVVRAEIEGPDDTPYERGTFLLDLQIPERCALMYICVRYIHHTAVLVLFFSSDKVG